MSGGMASREARREVHALLRRVEQLAAAMAPLERPGREGLEAQRLVAQGCAALRAAFHAEDHRAASWPEPPRSPARAYAIARATLSFAGKRGRETAAPVNRPRDDELLEVAGTLRVCRGLRQLLALREGR